jgi:hypothetical protein
MNYDLERMQTDKPADWIAKVAAQNPATLLPSGNVRVFGRGAFVNVAAPAKDSTDATGNIVKGKFGMTLLFPTGYDLTALRKARADLIPTAFPKNPQGIGLKDPIKDQADKVAPAEGGANPQGKTLSGFVPGAFYVAPNANLEYPPTLQEFVNGAPSGVFGTTEERVAKFYSGAWYMVTLSAFHGRNPQNPNVFYGLSSVLKVGDDRRFSGGGGDGAEAYAGINIEPDGINPESLF